MAIKILGRDRVFFRQPKRMWKDLCRCKNRIKGMLPFSGFDIPEQYDNASWSLNFINWLNVLDYNQPAGPNETSGMHNPSQ